MADRHESSTRAIVQQVGVNHQTVCRVLKVKLLHPLPFSASTSFVSVRLSSFLDFLHGERYRIFLEKVVPELLQDVPISTPNHMWFEHNGMTAHFSVYEHLPEYHVWGLINRLVPVSWSIPWKPRSPDLSPLHNFLWWHLKNLLQETPLYSDEDVVALTFETAALVCEIPGIFEHVRQSLHRCCQPCIATGGCDFEHFCKYYTCQQRFH